MNSQGPHGIRQIVSNNLSYINQYILAQALMAMEEVGVLNFVDGKTEFSVPFVAEQLRLQEHLLHEMCEFLTEQGVFEKLGSNTFRLVYAHSYFKWAVAGCLLTDKNIYESFAELMNGQEKFGKEVTRSESYFTDTGAHTKNAIPLLLDRFSKLGIKQILDLGCGTGSLIFSFINESKTYSAIGVEINRRQVSELQNIISSHSDGARLAVFWGDVQNPASFPSEAKKCQALVEMAVFHEFRSIYGEKLIPLLSAYKELFPHSRLFLVEPGEFEWGALNDDPENIEKKLARFLKVVHAFSDQPCNQTSREWISTIEKSGWRVKSVTSVFPALMLYECE